MHDYYFLITKGDGKSTVGMFDSFEEYQAQFLSCGKSGRNVTGYLYKKCTPERADQIKALLTERLQNRTYRPIRISEDALFAYCIKRGFYPSPLQMDKFMLLAKDGDLDRLATAIWACWDNAVSIDQIKFSLVKTEESL